MNLKRYFFALAFKMKRMMGIFFITRSPASYQRNIFLIIFPSARFSCGASHNLIMKELSI